MWVPILVVLGQRTCGTLAWITATGVIGQPQCVFGLLSVPGGSASVGLATGGNPAGRLGWSRHPHADVARCSVGMYHVRSGQWTMVASMPSAGSSPLTAPAAGCC